MKIIVEKGERKKEYKFIPHSLVFSADGKRLIFQTNDDKGWFTVFDGVESRYYQALHMSHTVISNDSKDIAYGVRDNGKWAMVVNGIIGKSYDELLPFAPVFFNKHNEITYGARDGAYWFYIVGSKASMRFEGENQLREELIRKAKERE